jgi:TetR/AcrR family transcriptional regulator
MKILGKNKCSVRDRLLKGASSLFSRKGYAATTVREIVAEAGVTKPVLYYYFKSKEGLYFTLMREGFSKLDELIRSVGGYEGNTREKLHRLCEQTFVLIQENVEIVRVMYSYYYGPRQGAPFSTLTPII